MKLKNSFFYTIRENIKDEESISGNLLVRSGMIKKTNNGTYMFMPLGFKSLKKIEKIIREEMDKTGAQELLMPCLIPEEYYVSSGRRDVFGSSMFSLHDRNNRPFVLGPTHEELFVLAASMKANSYKDMPYNIYQFGTKFRDEPRPRYGLIRVREFIMKDAYSFDIDDKNSDISYQKMFNAYKNSFDRMHLDYRIVKADTGAMGGLLSEEFQAVTDIGEDVLVICNGCDYSSNIEVSECLENKIETKEGLLPKELKETPNAGTILEVSNYLGLDPSKFVKTLIYEAEGKVYACLVKGDRDVNELKLSKLLNVKEISLAQPEVVTEVTKARVGFAGPIGIDVPIIMDNDIKYMKNFIVGANKDDHHYINVNLDDFIEKVIITGDIKNVKEGDMCPKCHMPLTFKKGIEVGNTFKLGTKYSELLDLKYLDENNNLKPVHMGCYGIGLGRCLAAIAEQHNDEKGLIWPLEIAPYEVAIVIINTNDEQQMEIANKLYETLQKENIDVILDDRDERPGVKFNDMDLIGIPYRITVGKKANLGIVEFKRRNNDMVLEYPYQEIINVIKDV